MTLRALEDYDRAISLDPNNVDAFYNRGLLRIKLNDQQEALADFENVIALTNDKELKEYASEWITELKNLSS